MPDNTIKSIFDVSDHADKYTLRKKLDGYIIKNSLIIEYFIMNNRGMSSPKSFSSISFTIDRLFELEKFNFNIFKFLKSFGRDNLMSLVTLYIFENAQLTNFISMEKFASFIKNTRKKYRNNPYHNVFIFIFYLIISKFIYFFLNK